MDGLEASNSEFLAVVRDLSFARDLPRVTEIVREAARRLTRSDGVTFVLKDRDQCFYADEDAIAPLWKGRRFPLHSCISGWVMEHRESVAIRDIYLDTRIPHEAYQPTFVKSLLMVPVRKVHPIAAIGAYWATEHLASDEERECLESLGEAASLALLNVQLWTDLKRALVREQQARRDAEHAREMAQDANALKDQFLANVSHELRTPLNVMQGWVSQMRRRALPPEALDKVLQTLERNTALQARLVGDLLDVSQAIAGTLYVDQQLLDLPDVTRLAVEQAQADADAHQITLSFAVEQAPPPMRGDAARLQQIVTNLLANAIKFTPAGGTVTVMVGRMPDHAFISVADSGIGISETFLPHVFDGFRQADSGTTRRYSGLGIGLTIVDHLVRLHGGTVAADSGGHNRGTTVRVELPLPSASATRAPVAESDATASAVEQPDASLMSVRLTPPAGPGIVPSH